MPTLNISKYFISALLVLTSLPALAQMPVPPASAPAATDEDTTTDKPIESNQHQLCIGVDVLQLAESATTSFRKSYEVAVEYFWKKDIYAVVEGGFGSSVVNYDYLAYKAHNSFVRVGINKCLLARQSPTDWDMAFLSLRLGIAPISIGNATYAINDSLWGNQSGSIPNRSFAAYWLEIGGGMRVELLKNFFAGWNIRGKFLVNTSQFKQLAPEYVAGYGKGDKNPIFDFNVYLSYAIRWNKQKKQPVAPVKEPLK